MHAGTALAATAAALLAATSATAQVRCGGPQSNAQFQRLLARPDPRVAQLMAGTWYAETRSPATGQVNYGYQTFQRNGLWQYHNRVCGGMLPACSDYEGHGLFAGVVQGDGSINVMIAYSDLRVTNGCTATVLRAVGPGVLRDGNGAIIRKIR